MLAAVAIGALHAGIVRRSNEILPKNEAKALRALERCEKRFQESKARQTLAAWEYGSNLTEYNNQRKIEASAEFAEVAKVREQAVWRSSPRHDRCLFVLFGF